MTEKLRQGSGEPQRECYEVDCRFSGTKTRGSVLKELILKELRGR